MSRVAKQPIPVPKGVDVKFDGDTVTVKGPKGELGHVIPASIKVSQVESELLIALNEEYDAGRNAGSMALAGTTRALLNNIVLGVSNGFERKLELVGVGYRAQMQGSKLNLTLGLSHPVNVEIPKGLTVTTPSQTEILIQGIDKQQVGQFAADIRAYRPPEPYKGKGIRYAGEHIVRKETKKK